MKGLDEKVVISFVGSRLENKGGKAWRKLESCGKDGSMSHRSWHV